MRASVGLAARLGLAALLVAACGGGGGKKQPATTSADSDTRKKLAECHEHANGPTRTECERTLARMRQVVPDDMDPDPEQDVCKCLAMPAPLISCLGDIATREDADRCVDEATGTERPTREACAAAVAHLQEIEPELAGEPAEELIDQCMTQGRPAELECIMKATTIDQVDNCDAL